MQEAMDNFLDSLRSSASWSDMNESTSWSWIGNGCIPNGVDLLTENQNDLASNLVTFANQNQLKITGINSPTHCQFKENSLNHQSCHSFSKFQHMAQNNDADCNVAAKPRVRARRGQATDPHSIAERLRREKIAERMKNLKELVPNSIKAH